MIKILILLFIGVVLVSPVFSSATAIINPLSAGANGEVYDANLANLTVNFFNPKFNSTQLWVDAKGVPLLTIPWFGSSTQCNVADLKTDYSNPANFTNYSQVTDELSEMGILISLSDIPVIAQTGFPLFDNTIHMIKSGYGQLPCWASYRNATALNCSVSDTASDASARIALAYFYASNNSNFNAAQRAGYLSMALNLTSDHLHYETYRVNKTITNGIGDGNINYWVSGGTEGIASNGNTSNPFIWTGYYRDFIPLMLIAYNQTGNTTYREVAKDYVEQYLLAVNYTGGTAKANFKVAPFNYGWGLNSNYPAITSANSFYFNASNTQWDDSDAPRDLWICDSLRGANLTFAGHLPTAFQNLSDYCAAWTATGTFTATQSTIQYYYNGSGSTTMRTGYYENGLGAGTHTYFNQNTLNDKINESLSHYSWTTGLSYDSTACYGVYRGIRPAYALAVAMGKTDQVYGVSMPGAIPLVLPTCNPGDKTSFNLILIFTGLSILTLALVLVAKAREGELELSLIITIFIAIIVGIIFFIQIANNLAGVCT